MATISVRIFKVQGVEVAREHRIDENYTELNVPAQYANYTREVIQIDPDAPSVPASDPSAARIAQIESIPKTQLTPKDIAEYLALKGHGPALWK